MRSGDSEGTTSNQKNGKFRLSSPRIDMGTAITLLESYELTGFLRICMTMIGTLPEFHDFILPLVSLWNTQFLCVKFIADFSVIIMASFGHQISLCRQFTYWTVFLPTPVRGAPWLLSKKHPCCKYPTKSHPMQGTPESKDAPREKQESVSLLPPAVTPPSIYVLSKSTHALNMSIELQTTTSLHSVSTSTLLDSGVTGMFVN